MRRLTAIMVVAFMCATLLVLVLPGATIAKPDRGVDTATGATPNYRTFMESDLKNMPLVGGHYTCSKSSDPYTYFEQDWRGVDLSYLLETEVGLKDDTTGIKIIAEDDYAITLTLDQMRGNSNPRGLASLLGWKNAEPSADNPNAPDGSGAPWVTPLPTNNV
ncbi:MAG: hypothetical protein JW738_07150, partial [Actinobacteria bacterium]|nr:hypothetical protein [Actinomycetota bacterium]